MSVEKGKISLLWKGVDLESTKGIWEQGREWDLWHSRSVKLEHGWLHIP